jgi:hypothetical protein
MSWVEAFSYWRCPNCNHENTYSLAWKELYRFKEYPHDTWTKETCDNCGKEYYVDITEPNPYCFRMNRGKCKNDYVRDMVVDINEKLTLVR